MTLHDGCADVYKNCKHYKVSNYCNRFLYITIGFTVFVFAAIIWVQYDFKQSQQKIIEAHHKHLTKTQECFTSIYDNLKCETANCDSIIYILEHDKALARKIVRYNAVKNLIVGLANNMSYRAMADELKKDSILINRQLETAQHTTNELLELHFNRVQHEYTVLALWAGILMIVFLIFSFYSLYKTDDIAKQGKEGLKEISQKGEDVLLKLKQEQKTLMSQAQNTIAEINKEAQEAQNKMNTLAETFESRIQALEIKAERLENLFRMLEQRHSIENESTK